MESLHGENGCQHPKIYGHGLRRRRCVVCDKTWTLWKRRRGRRLRPRRTRLLKRTFVDDLTLTQQSRRSKIEPATLSKRHRQLLVVLERRTPRIMLARDRLILIIDGLWFLIRKKRWVLYLMALRGVHSSRATFLPPRLLHGNESQTRWREVMNTIPEPWQSRICALVSDQFRGVEALAYEHGWLLQLCHFHLIASLQGMLGTRKRTVGWRIERRRAYQAICELIVTRDPERLKELRHQLEQHANDPRCPRMWRYRLRGFLRSVHLYRTYLQYPELVLPTTTNVIESLNSRLRMLAQRSHGFRSPRSLERWMKAYLRFHPDSTCNGKILQN